jgi:hypothetical protein
MDLSTRACEPRSLPHACAVAAGGAQRGIILSSVVTTMSELTDSPASGAKAAT